MSRRICVALYDEIIKLRPEWHSEDDNSGAVKIVMTGAASDPVEWQQHIGNKARRDLLAKRARDPKDPLKLVIVRDMWLTGFDAPSMHTMYIDKPMRGHGLMQAIARVNRVFRDKPAGLIVDYIGIAQNLKAALAQYSKPDQDKTGPSNGYSTSSNNGRLPRKRQSPRSRPSAALPTGYWLCPKPLPWRRVLMKRARSAKRWDSFRPSGPLCRRPQAVAVERARTGRWPFSRLLVELWCRRKSSTS